MIVFMFHSMGLENSRWAANYLSIPVKHFEKWFEYLAVNKYKTLFLEDWYINPETTFIRNDKKLVITFDDGYLDNWVYLFPLLEKYQLKATIFINPEFVDPSNNVRPKYTERLIGNNSPEIPEPLGFMNWGEISYMHASGLVDFQSHSMSHDWFFVSNKIIDFYAPGDKTYYWLNWIEMPDKKYSYFSQPCEVEAGYPIFDYGRSLGIRRYFPNRDIINYSIESYRRYKNQKGSADLIDMVNHLYLEKACYGNIETDAQMIQRYTFELTESKSIIESRLKKSVDFLCWPGGAYNEISVALSKIAGYRASTLASRDRVSSIDNSRAYKRIPRFNLGVNINYKNKVVIDPNPYALKNNFIEFEGSLHKKLNRMLKKIYYIGFK